MIKNFRQYNESFKPEDTESPDTISDINSFNDDEEIISDFNKNKSILSNIYTSYKNEKELFKKLIDQKFTNNTSDKKSTKFKNPLLGMWAKSCSMRRELTDITNQISKFEIDIKNEQENIKNNPSMKDSSMSNIELTQNKIREKREQINKIQSDITKSEKTTMDNLKKMKDQTSSSKKRLDTYTTTKFSKK